MSMEQVTACRLALNEVLRSDAGGEKILDALEVLNRRLALLESRERHDALASGRRGDSASRANGFTETETMVLRRFASCGVVTHAEVPSELYRYVSAIRRKCKTIAPAIKIVTRTGAGYELIAGFDDLWRLLHVAKTPALTVAGFTTRQSEILQVLAVRGSIHTEWGKAVQRHMSNIRKKLPRGIVIETHAGEGLYTLTKGREALTRLIAGEGDARPSPSKEPALLAA